MSAGPAADLHGTLSPQPLAIDAALVARVAHLARLRLQPDEAVQLEHDLAIMLGYVEQLRTVETAGVEPMQHPWSPAGEGPGLAAGEGPGLASGEGPGVSAATPLREDLVVPGLDLDAVSRGAPAMTDGSFSVPRVIG